MLFGERLEIYDLQLFEQLLCGSVRIILICLEYLERDDQRQFAPNKIDYQVFDPTSIPLKAAMIYTLTFHR